MAQIGIDYAFLHYGVRQDDLDVIETLAVEQGLNPEGVTELLKNYNSLKVERGEIDLRDLKRFLSQNINSLIPKP